MKILLDTVMDGIYFFNITEAGDLYSAKLLNSPQEGNSVKLYYGLSGKSSCAWLGPDLSDELDNKELTRYMKRSIESYFSSNIA